MQKSWILCKLRAPVTLWSLNVPLIKEWIFLVYENYPFFSKSQNLGKRFADDMYENCTKCVNMLKLLDFVTEMGHFLHNSHFSPTSDLVLTWLDMTFFDKSKQFVCQNKWEFYCHLLMLCPPPGNQLQTTCTKIAQNV